MGYKIAINQMALTEKLPVGDHRWTDFNDGFQNVERETLDFANDIYMGRSYAAWHNGRRKVENFICAQHIAVDMESGDKRSTLNYIKDMEFVSIYGGLIYTTPSHTEADPRSRIVFFLDQPIDNGESYKKAIGFIYSLFPGSDTSCVDCSRFFYGSRSCQIEWIDNTLPLAHLRRFYKKCNVEEQPVRAQAVQPRATTEQKQTQVNSETAGIVTPDTLLNYAISDATTEGRNKRGYRLARQLRELGLTQFDAQNYLLKYQASVATNKQHAYTEQEALTNLRSAYSRAMAS